MSFFETHFLWFEAVVASMAVAAALAVVGVYTILRRVVFLPAALSQISGLGVVLAFLFIMWIPWLESSFLGNPDLISLLITLGAALLLGWIKEPKHLSKEAFIGIAYIVASALVIIVGDRIPQESHDIQNILFGNAVAVETKRMYTALAVAAVVLAVHVLMLRPFLLASFDPSTARAHGVPTRAIDAALFFTMGLTISTATRTIGAMPVFALSVLPAAASLNLFHNIRFIFLGAAIMGMASAFLGYYVSFVWSFPTGACIVAVAALFFLSTRAFSPKSWFKSRKEPLK